MRKNKYVNLIKDTMLFALGSLGSKLILFFMLPLYTNYLSTEQYGTTELILTFAQFIIPIAALVIHDGVIRFGLENGANKENVLKCGFLVTTLGSVLAVAITPLIGLYGPVNEWKWFICGYVILNMYAMLFQNYLKVQNRNLLYAIAAIVQTLVLALLNVLLLVVKNFGVAGYLYAMLGSQLIAVIICVIFGNAIGAIIKGKLDKETLKKMVVYSAPLVLNNISWWIIHSSDKIMIELMVSTAALGIYTVAAKIPALVNMATTIFQQAWGISAIKEVEDTNDTDFYANIFTFLQIIVFGLSIALIFIAKPFLSFYVNESFFEAWQYVPLLLVGAAFCAISSYYGSLYAAMKKSVNNMVTTLVAAIVNIVVNYIGILYLGVWGAVIGTATAYIVISSIRMIDCRRYVKIKLRLLPFFANAAILIAQATLVSFGINVYLVSSVALALFLIINIKTIIRMVKALFRNRKKTNEESN